MTPVEDLAARGRKVKEAVVSEASRRYAPARRVEDALMPARAQFYRGGALVAEAQARRPGANAGLFAATGGAAAFAADYVVMCVDTPGGELVVTACEGGTLQLSQLTTPYAVLAKRGEVRWGKPCYREGSDVEGYVAERLPSAFRADVNSFLLERMGRSAPQAEIDVAAAQSLASMGYLVGLARDGWLDVYRTTGWRQAR